MINCIKEEQGKIIAYLEWWQVGRSGVQKPYGEFMFVNDLWIHPEYRGKNLTRKMVEDVLLEHPEIEAGYWRREKYFDRVSRLMTRERFMKETQWAVQKQ